jgi:hypothetical protein
MIGNLKRSITKKVKDKHMPKASEVAVELRKLADSIERGGDTAVPSATVLFGRDYAIDDKDRFLAIARLMPKPLTKEYTEREVKVRYITEAVKVSAYIDRSGVCKIIKPAQPAVYDCEPLLSEVELATVEA